MRGGGEGEQEEEEGGCLCKVVMGWVKKAIQRGRGEWGNADLVVYI